MSKLLAVVWNVNTATSAPMLMAQVRANVIAQANSEPALSNYISTTATNTSRTRDQVIDEIAQRWEPIYNQRDPFTGLLPTARAGILDTAVKAAASWAWSKGNPDLIFVAPEYLFAQSGFHHLLDGGTHLSAIQANIVSISRRNPHVLLFPGTIAYREPMKNQSVRARARLYDDMEFWNKAGRSGWMDEKNRDKIQRIAIRGDDFELAQNKAYAYLAGQKVLEYTKRGDFHEVTRKLSSCSEFFHGPFK